MNRNKFNASRYIIQYAALPPKTNEEMKEFFQSIIDNTRTMVCEEIKEYLDESVKKRTSVTNLKLEIEAAIEYLNDKADDSPDQLKLNL
jgi:hypothetical protein